MVKRVGPVEPMNPQGICPPHHHSPFPPKIEGLVQYKRAVPTASWLAEHVDAKTGELYYCQADKYFYLSIGEGEYKKIPSKKVIDSLPTIPGSITKEQLDEILTDLQVARKYDLALKDSFTPTRNAGEIKAGNEIPSGTSLESILKSILTSTGEEPEDPDKPGGGGQPLNTFKIFTGVVNEIPSSLEGLEEHEINVDEFKTNPKYVFRQINANNQYPVLAIEKSINYACYDLKASGFSLSFIEIEIGDYYLYYLETPMTDTGARFEYYFEEI